MSIDSVDTEKIAAPPGSFSCFPGVHVTVSNEDVGDYLAMKSAQLTALTGMMAGEYFDHQSATVRSNIKWLASSLASEIDRIIPIALLEARNTG